MNLVMPARVGPRTAAFRVAEARVKGGCLKGMGAERHLVTAAAADLLLAAARRFAGSFPQRAPLQNGSAIWELMCLMGRFRTASSAREYNELRATSNGTCNGGR